MVGTWAIGLYALAKRSSLPDQWGVWALIAFYTLVSLGGYAGVVTSLPYGSVGFRTSQITPDEYAESAVDLLGLAGFFAFGAAVGWGRVTVERRRPYEAWDIKQLTRGLTPFRFVIVGFMILGLSIIGYGPSSLLTRETYLTHDYESLLILGDALAPVLIFMVWATVGVQHSHRLLVVAAGLSVAFGAFYLGRASRSLGLIVLLSGLGYLLGSWSERRAWRNLANLVVLSLVSAVVLLIPLQLRGSGDHGLGPYLQFLMTGKLTMGLESGGVDFATVSSNVFSGLAVTAESRLIVGDWGDLAVQLNPLPGAVVGWYDIAASYRLTVYVPANTPGTLLAFGRPIAALIYLATGYTLARMGTWSARANAWPFLVVNGISMLAALFAITSLQYSARSSFRYIWYGIIAAIVAIVVRRLRDGRSAGARHSRSARARAFSHRG